MSLKFYSFPSSLMVLLFQVVLITHHQNYQSADTVKKFLMDEQNIPEEFISIKNQDVPCEAQKSFMHFCLDETNELRILKLDRERSHEIFGRYKNKKGFN